MDNTAAHHHRSTDGTPNAPPMRCLPFSHHHGFFNGAPHGTTTVAVPIGTYLDTRGLTTTCNNGRLRWNQQQHVHHHQQHILATSPTPNLADSTPSSSSKFGRNSDVRGKAKATNRNSNKSSTLTLLPAVTEAEGGWGKEARSKLSMNESKAQLSPPCCRHLTFGGMLMQSQIVLVPRI